MLMALFIMAAGMKIRSLDLVKCCMQMAHFMRENGAPTNGMAKASL